MAASHTKRYIIEVKNGDNKWQRSSLIPQFFLDKNEAETAMKAQFGEGLNNVRVRTK